MDFLPGWQLRIFRPLFGARRERAALKQALYKPAPTVMEVEQRHGRRLVIFGVVVFMVVFAILVIADPDNLFTHKSFHWGNTYYAPSGSTVTGDSHASHQ